MAQKQVGANPSDTSDLVTKGYVDTATVPVANISASGSPGSTTYLRGDGTWASPPTFSTGKAIAMAIVFG